MRFDLAAVFLALAVSAGPFPAAAQQRVTLGIGHLFTNDFLGDGQDRWRTGGYALSWMRGPEGLAGLPETPGALIEYRYSNRVLAPANLVTPAPGDRPYAGIAALGLYTHFATRGFEVSGGAELVAVGPMTGLAEFQSFAHGLAGDPAPSPAVKAAQLGNALYPSAQIEAGRRFSFGAASLRPFVEMRAGDETYARVGADILFGSAFNSGVLVRDANTGFLYQTIDRAPARGYSFLVGADTAKVLSSAWLPAPTYTLTDLRSRVRAGLHWQGDWLGVFYGATWTGPEFTAQPSSQVQGALQVQLRF